MKPIYNFTKPTKENIFLHSCNGIAHTFDRIDDSPAYIYTIFGSDESIMTYASTSDYDLFKLQMGIKIKRVKIMNMVGCTKLFDSIYCIDCDKSGDPGTCLGFRIHGKRQALIKKPNGEIVVF